MHNALMGRFLLPKMPLFCHGRLPENVACH
nr:MAG TPA: hypothetical protein [Caudoviricetes sp.]